MKCGRRLATGTAYAMVATGALIMAAASPVSAQTNGANAIKILDINNDGAVDLAESRSVGAETFDRLDIDKSGTLDQEELGKRALTGVTEGPVNSIFFQTNPPKDDYLAMITKQFELADYADHDGKLNESEFDSPEGQKLLKLLL